MREVDDAVILAGGRGTRMLPGSIYVPKEIMPLIDTPILNHLIWESCKAGVKRIHIVVSPTKKDILSKIFNDDKIHWDESIRPDLPRIALSPLPKGVEIILHEQVKPGGVGDAILLASKFIKNSFLVLLGDNLLISEHIDPKKSGPEFASGACQRMVKYYNQTGKPCAGILEVPDDQINKYGIVELEAGLINKIIEKPNIEDAPSNFILCGRYLLPGNCKEILNLYSNSDYGELQSIALFDHLINNGGFGGIKMNDFVLYDSGDPVNWLKSQIDHALRRNDLDDGFRQWMESRLLE